ncbi:MAG: hypothetical protein NVS3B17_18530 [Vulcanimicrobiaceae bacterium]
MSPLRRRRTASSRYLAALLGASMLFTSALPAQAASASGTLLVRVTNPEGTPVVRARVTLLPTDGRLIDSTDREGRAQIADLAPGTYAVSAGAPDYAPLSPQPVTVGAGERAVIDLTLARSPSSLTTIGYASAAGNRTVSTSTAPTQNLDAQAYAARGFTRIGDVLADALSATVIRQGSGSPAAPQSIALRGPDPTETLVDIDGHETNGGATGDFDLSLLDPADFDQVQVVYGIAPSALVGPSTIGGAINVRTLEPTARPHGLMRLSVGSYSAFAQTLQATGTADRLGYAFSLHQANSANAVSHTLVSDAGGDATVVGSDVDGKTALAKVRYALGPARSGYAQLTVRNQSVVRDISGALTSLVASQSYATSPDSKLFDHNAAYALDVQLPLETDTSGAVRTSALYRHQTSNASRSVAGDASGLSATYFNNRDRIDDDSLEIDRTFAKGSVALKYRSRREALDTFDPTIARQMVDQSTATLPLGVARRLDALAATDDDTTISLAQRQASLALRLTYDPTARLHYTLAAYQSAFSSFGHSFDPRFGVAYTPTSRTALHASIGTTFQAPQLTELYVPATLPRPDANGHISIGNASLRADHATEYDIGFEQLVGERTQPTRLSADFYRTNLRSPSQRLIPDETCTAETRSLDCASYPINVGRAVYTGAEMRLERSFAPGTTLRLGYAVASSYAVDAPDAIQNGSIVPHQQFLGVPLHKATVDFEHRAATGISYDAAMLYEGRYNELNRGPFATLRASIGTTVHGFDLVLAGTNLTNTYATRFTQAGLGVPYGGTDEPIATDAYALPNRTFTLSLTRRF